MRFFLWVCVNVWNVISKGVRTAEEYNKTETNLSIFMEAAIECAIVCVLLISYLNLLIKENYVSFYR